jgi:RNA polymerase sigma-70 factor (ECF subfamily)
MESPLPGEITLLLNRVTSQAPDEYNRLAELVYAELRRIAGRVIDTGTGDRTLQPTIMVHDAFIRLVDGNSRSWESRAHFFAVAAQAMRRIVVDSSRHRRAQKRGGAWQRVDLEEASSIAVDRPEQILAVDEALKRLEQIDKRQAQIVVMRYFGGFTEEETAALMGISPRTVKRDWSVARTWLHAELSRTGSHYSVSD